MRLELRQVGGSARLRQRNNDDGEFGHELQDFTRRSAEEPIPGQDHTEAGAESGLGEETVR